MLRTWALYSRSSRVLKLMIGAALVLLGVASVSCLVVYNCPIEVKVYSSNSGRKLDSRVAT
jgi:hypothetical protein